MVMRSTLRSAVRGDREPGLACGPPGASARRQPAPGRGARALSNVLFAGSCHLRARLGLDRGRPIGAAEHPPHARRGVRRLSRRDVAHEIGQRALGVGAAPHRLIEQRQPGPRAHVLRVEAHFLFEVRLGLLIALEARERIADHEIQISRLGGALRVALLCVEQKAEGPIVLLAVVGDGAADERRHRQPGVRRGGELGLTNRFVIALASDLDERDGLVRLGRRARERQLARAHAPRLDGSAPAACSRRRADRWVRRAAA